MRYFNFFLVIVTCMGMLGSCSTDSAPPPLPGGNFEKSSFDNGTVLTFYQRNNSIFAGTDQGIFTKSLVDETNTWTYIGLGSDSTEVIDIIAWDSKEIMVAINYSEFSINNDVIRKTEDGGNTWVSLTDNFTGENVNNFLRRLALDLNKPDEIFALGGLPIARSTDGGQSWEAVFETWQLGAFGRFITIDYQNPNIIWSGGATNGFTPSLVKSTDGGDTWQRLQVIENVETTVHDLVINPKNSDHVLAGLSGAVGPANAVRKSTNGGTTWSTVLEGYNVRSLAHSARTPTTVYATGINEARSPFFAASTNFGDDWQIVEMEGATEALFINDIISVMEDSREVLYLATTKGVYRFTFEE